MVTHGTQVDPGALERVADDVELLREDLDQAAKLVASEAEEVGRKLAGWRLARATEHTAFGWHDDATQASSWLADHATALQRCAQDYRYADQVTAEALTLFPEVE